MSTRKSKEPKHKDPVDLWPNHIPPEDLEQAGHDINMSICRAALDQGETNTRFYGIARRGCGDVWSRVKNSALLYDTVQPDAWERVRKLGPKPPEDDGDRCLWLLAAAWRAIQWLDNEKLVQQQLNMIRRFVTNLKSGVSSLPNGFVLEAEKTLHQDENERNKPKGPKPQRSRMKKTNFVN